jgi:ribose transport system ATP-binding protein
MTLSFRNISKRFGGIQALRSVSVDVEPGEIHALVGANGAGKSTLMKILSGLVTPDEGEIVFEGRPIRIESPIQAHRLGIGLVPQETTLCENLSIAENVFLGTFAWLDRAKLEAETRRRLHDLGLDYDPAAPVSRLSVAQKQLVQIVRALAFEPRVLALDEPTASLSEGEVETLFAVLRDLKGRGVTLLFVSHRLKEVLALADRATVLRDGEKVGTVPARQTSREELVRMMAGKDVAQERSRGTAGEEILRVEGDVSFSVRRGEILGWFGLVGAGRSEAAQALFGVDPFHGRVSIDRREVRIAHPRDAIRNGIGLVPEDRKLQGLVLKMAITPNVTLASLDRLSTAGVLTAAREQAVAAEYIDTLRIRCAGPGQPVEELSGGNQQKVVLARWLDTRPRVLILDEPTKGVDIAAKAEIHSIVRELARSGTAVILISSELDEIQQMADRILVFRAGRIRGEFTSASDAQLLSAATQ